MSQIRVPSVSVTLNSPLAGVVTVPAGCSRAPERVPGVDCRVEVRRIWELEDFPQDVQDAIPYDSDLHPGV